MKLIRPAGLAFAAALLAATHAAALSEDDKTANAPAASQRFADPDDQVPVAVNLSGANITSSGADPTASRYDYDPASGTYVPHQR